MNKFFLFLCLALFIQCSNDDDVQNLNTVNLFYAQTSCADPWAGPHDSDEELRVIVGNYLVANVSENFTNLELSFDTSFTMACLACSCTTGKIFHITTDKEEMEKFVEIGFREN